MARWEGGDVQPLPWLRPQLAEALKVSPERIEALLAGPESAGPGGAVPGVPLQLPAAVADFTGRVAELQTLAGMLDQRGERPAGTVVISAIGGMLIVLDNARDGQQVRPLLPAGPACLILLTSRNQIAGPTTSAIPAPARSAPSSNALTVTRGW